MRNIIHTFFFLCLALSMNAQDKYSYLEDRVFNNFDDMVGYNFVPDGMEIRNEYDQELDPGEYTFGITRANIYVSGDEVKGVYNVNQIGNQKYGYKLTLMDPRDPTSRGHLKIILNKKSGYVDALIFKKNNDDKEMIFFIPPTPDETYDEEATYFTDKFENKVEEIDSLWNKSIQPFIVVENKYQTRLEMTDSTSIAFIETVKITEKKKRVKKSKKKKKKKKRKNYGEEIDVEFVEDEMVEEEKEDEDEDYDDEDEDEELTEEQLMEEDKAAMKALGLEDEEEEAEEVKVKVDKSYFIEIKQKVELEDGTFENKVMNYPIKKVVERENEEAKPGQDRYEIEFSTSKGGSIYLYLTGKRTISSLKTSDRKFLMRGN